MTPEGRIKARFKRELKRRLGEHCYQFWPVQTGMGATTLDCLLCIRGTFVAVETKAPGKKPTPRQELVIEQIGAAGGAAWVIDSNEAIDHFINWYDTNRGL